MDYLSVDGSILEGGGQILRNVIALSAIKKRPVRIFNIRAGRKKPGLAEQHLKGIELVRDMCNGNLKGGQLGSQEIYFNPGIIRGGTFEARVNTAGSIALLMQISIPVALFAPEPVLIKLFGGTDADFAPTIDYMTNVTIPLLKKFGADINIELIKRGFFPRGGGILEMSVKNLNDGLKPIEFISKGNITQITGTCVVGGSCPLRVGHEMKAGAENILLEKYGKQIDHKILVKQFPANCPGSSITLYGTTTTGCIFGSDIIGNRNTKPLVTGQNASQELINEFSLPLSCVDRYAQDQIILPMALAKGVSTVQCGPLTLHTKTSIAIVEMLTKVKFQVTTLNDEENQISCTGESPV